ncbi:MAG: hypothetical protein K1X33_09115 [Methanobacteriaceae archaeon]|nr:hypothetical protein [Methanobacteriaceae archaeon]
MSKIDSNDEIIYHQIIELLSLGTNTLHFENEKFNSDEQYYFRKSKQENLIDIIISKGVENNTVSIISMDEKYALF